MPNLHLHGIPQSNFVWAARIAFAEKGVEPTLIPDAPHEGGAAGHPLGKIPVLVQGSVTVAESRAIALYADRAFDGPPLQSTDPVAAAREEMWVSIILTAVEPVLIRQLAFAYIFPGTPDGSPNRAAIEECLEASTQMVAVLAKATADGAILAEQFQLPDAWAIPILFYTAQTAEWPALTEGYPELRDALKAALERPSVRATTPPPLAAG